jgi:hypothetical protein
MTNELGISKWLSMSSNQRKNHLQSAEKERIAKLQKLTYKESVKQTHRLLRLVDLIPHKQHRHKPVGIGVTLGTHKI